jgi:hypothetical protein
MELKNAVAVCLISVFSATLVVLIARALDLQAASRIEPQLAQIVDELRSLRKSGGISTSSSGVTEKETLKDGVIVYYFHSNMRCPTCRSIETQSHKTVESDFAAQLSSGEVVWKTVNYEQPSAADLAKKFEIQMPVVVVAKMKDGQIADWKRLDQVWALVGDKPAFAKYVHSEISEMLGAGGGQPTLAPSTDPVELPIPNVEANDAPPLPAPNKIPLPE